MLILCTGIAYGQNTDIDLEKKYETALLDTAIRYELLKPVTVSLRKANDQYKLESQASTMQIQFLVLSRDNERKEYSASIDRERKKRLKTMGIAALGGLLLGLIVGL